MIVKRAGILTSFAGVWGPSLRDGGVTLLWGAVWPWAETGRAIVSGMDHADPVREGCIENVIARSKGSAPGRCENWRRSAGLCCLNAARSVRLLPLSENLFLSK
jgi:hypothetical protein